MSSMTVELPETVSESDARFLLALQLFEDDRISSGKAAELAGCSKRDFMLKLGERGIPVFDYAPGEIARDVKNAAAAGE